MSLRWLGVVLGSVTAMACGAGDGADESGRVEMLPGDGGLPVPGAGGEVTADDDATQSVSGARDEPCTSAPSSASEPMGEAGGGPSLGGSGSSEGSGGAGNGGSMAGGGAPGVGGSIAWGGAAATGGAAPSGGTASSGGAAPSGASGAPNAPADPWRTLDGPFPTGDCTGLALQGELVSAQAPVVLAATIAYQTTDRSYTSGIFIAPTSATDTAYVALASPEQLALVGPSGVSVVPTGVCGDSVKIVVDPEDTPWLFAHVDENGNGGFVRTFSAWTPTGETPAAPWSHEYIASGFDPVGGYGVTFFAGYQGTDAVLVGDQLRALMYDRNYEREAEIVDRTGSGSWQTGDVLGGGVVQTQMAVDSLGRTRVVIASSSAGGKRILDEWTDGAEHPAFAESVEPGVFALAAGGEGTLAVALQSKTGIAVSITDSQSVSEAQEVPDTALYDGLNCDPNTYCDEGPQTCDREAVPEQSFALAASDDGVYWLVLRRVHRVETWAVSPDDKTFNPRYCWVPVEQSLTAEVLLFRLGTDASTAPELVWSQPTEVGGLVDLAARGDRLYVGVAGDRHGELYVLDRSGL